MSNFYRTIYSDNNFQTTIDEDWLFKLNKPKIKTCTFFDSKNVREFEKVFPVLKSHSIVIKNFHKKDYSDGKPTSFKYLNVKFWSNE